MNDINNIYDLLVFLQTNINNVKQYCVICQTKLNWQSGDLLACENHECQILYEESLFGNYVIPNYKLDTDIFMFHITSAIDAINNIFLINGETTSTQLRITQKCAQRLVREFVKLKNNNIGYTINVNKNDLTLWNLSLNQFDEQYNICKDMIKHNINEMVLEMRFSGDYPMSPPFIRIIRPRILPLTGHITSHGVIYMELLTKSGWSPACSIETLLVTIKSEIIEGDGRLDMTNTNDYDYNDAKQSFVNMCKIHKWEN